MGDSQKQSVVRSRRRRPPWILHFQKMGLELKCPLCLSLLKEPILLPCDHVFCKSCLPESAQFESECPVCQAQYVDKDLRPMPLIENLVAIYKTLDGAFSANLFPTTSSDSVRASEVRPASISRNHNLKLAKELFKAAYDDNLTNGRAECSLQSNKLDQVPLNCSGQNEGQDKDLEDVQRMPSNVEGREHEMVDSGGHGFDGQRNITSPSVSFLASWGLHDSRIGQIDTNLVSQFSPDSPPSFGDLKDSENDSNDQGVDDQDSLLDGSPLIAREEQSNSESAITTSQNYRAAKLAKRKSDSRIRQEGHDCSTSGAEVHLSYPKRHRKLNCANLELKSAVPLTGSQSHVVLDDSSTIEAVCGFCQRSRITGDTGPMLHYVNGKQVEGDEATLPDAIHVHMICIEWAPQVYYAGETVKNLKAELARGAKLKCSGCGLKGAALGCYLKSCRRSYHVPCAMEINKCRWDFENFLLLCPAHASTKFPKEKSKPSKQNLEDFPIPTQIDQQSRFWTGSCERAKEWVFCGSDLSSEDKCLLIKFGRTIGVPVTKFWKPTVTHVIAATDTNGACTRTLKVLMAIVNGRWVLTIDWIKACMESMNLVDEEPYEVSLDNYGCSDGPRTGRLSSFNEGSKLFNGLNFFFVGDFLLGYKEDLQNLVIAAGGTILESEAELIKQCPSQIETSKTLVVYNIESPEGSKLEEEVSIIWQRHSKAENLAAKTGSLIIGHTWLLESIAAYKLQPVVTTLT